MKFPVDAFRVVYPGGVLNRKKNVLVLRQNDFDLFRGISTSRTHSNLPLAASVVRVKEEGFERNGFPLARITAA